MKPWELLLVLSAVIAVAVADIFLKETSRVAGFGAALRTPWFWGAIFLYLYQVAAFTYLFVANVELSVVGIIQTTLYAIIVLAAGLIIFRETLTPLQYVGLALAIVGVLLINLPT